MIPANPGGGWDQTGRASPRRCRARSSSRRVQFDNKGGAAGTIGLAQFVNSAQGRPERGDDRRHGDGRRHHHRQVAGQPVAGHADRAPDQRIRRVRGAGELAAQDDGATWSRSSRRNPGSVVGRRLGRRHRPHPGRPDRAGGRRRRRRRSTTCRSRAAARRSRRSSAATSPPGARGFSEFAEHIKAGKMRALAQSAPEQGIDGIAVAEGAGHRRRDRQLARRLRRARHHAAAARGAGRSWCKAATRRRRGRRRSRRSAGTAWFLGGDAFAKFLEEDEQRIASIMDSLGLKK